VGVLEVLIVDDTSGTVVSVNETGIEVEIELLGGVVENGSVGRNGEDDCEQESIYFNLVEVAI